MAKKTAKKASKKSADQDSAAPEAKASSRKPAVKAEGESKSSGRNTPIKPESSRSSGRRAKVMEEISGDDIAKAVDEGSKSSLSQRISLKKIMVEMSRGKEPIQLHHRALTKAELRELREKMMDRLRQLSSDVEQMEVDMLSSDSVTRAGTDVIDQSSAQYEQEFKLQRVESEASEIALIRRALAKMGGRIKDMEYGRCEATGVWISIERLRAIPHARLCVAAVERFEREGGGEEFGIQQDRR